jgi:hypothetical protein
MDKDKIIALFTLLGFAVIFAILMDSWAEDIIFYLTHKTPAVTETTTAKINIMYEPVQKNLPENQKMFQKEIKKKLFFLAPIAEYEISGRVLAVNMKLGIWGVSRRDFDYIALTDVVLAWQDVADIKLYEQNVKNLKQSKSPAGGRYYRFYVPYGSIWDVGYVSARTSHNHIIPATENVMAALYSLKKYDVVKMKGYLVDIYKDGNVIAMKSDSRYDSDGSSRGREQHKPGGSCEVFYAASVQVEDKIYR